MTEQPLGALEKGLIILRCFSREKIKITLHEISKITGINKTTVHRNLKVLIQYSFIFKNEDGTYSLGSELSRLGFLYTKKFPFMERINELLQDILNEFNESTAFYIPGDNTRICIYAYNADRIVYHKFNIGDHIKLNEGGSAGHIISFFTGKETPHAEEIEKNKCIVGFGEREEGQASISLPVFDLKNKFIGAIVIAGSEKRYNPDYCQKIIQYSKKEIMRKGFTLTLYLGHKKTP